MDLSTSKPITADLPERATIFELAMTPPTEGWLVGAVFAPDHRTLQSGLIMRYHDNQWRPIEDAIPVAILDGIAVVSADEGWVTGYSQSQSQSQSQSYLLHYMAGHWQPVEVPLQPAGGSFYGGIRMYSADEAWIVVNSEYSWKGQIESLLLHYRNGAWTPVTVPTPLVWDFAPVGPDDLWLVGNASVRSSDCRDSTLAHFQRGQWTTTPAPDHALLHTLHMWSASAGYAVGSQPQPPGWNRTAPSPAVVLRYDGRTWDPIQTGADPAAQQIEIFDDADAWAFVRTPAPTTPLTLYLVNEIVSAAQRTVGRIASRWQVVKWPFTDIISISPMVRAAPDEYWAATHYVVPPEVEGHFHWEFCTSLMGLCTSTRHAEPAPSSMSSTAPGQGCCVVTAHLTAVMPCRTPGLPGLGRVTVPTGASTSLTALVPLGVEQFGTLSQNESERKRTP
jgi:hypothetical protein